jgi:hypothetical protein
LFQVKEHGALILLVIEFLFSAFMPGPPINLGKKIKLATSIGAVVALAADAEGPPILLLCRVESSTVDGEKLAAAAAVGNTFAVCSSDGTAAVRLSAALAQLVRPDRQPIHDALRDIGIDSLSDLPQGLGDTIARARDGCAANICAAVSGVAKMLLAKLPDDGDDDHAYEDEETWRDKLRRTRTSLDKIRIDADNDTMRLDTVALMSSARAHAPRISMLIVYSYSDYWSWFLKQRSLSKAFK